MTPLRRGLAVWLSLGLVLGSVDRALAQVRLAVPAAGEAIPAGQVRVAPAVQPEALLLPQAAAPMAAGLAAVAPSPGVALKSSPAAANRVPSAVAAAPAAAREVAQATLVPLAAAGREFSDPAPGRGDRQETALRRLFLGEARAAKPDLSPDAVENSAPMGAPSRSFAGLRRWVAAAMLGAALLSPAAVTAQNEPPAPIAAQAAAPIAEAPRASLPAADAKVAIQLERREFPLADPVRVEFSIRNESDKPLAVPMAEFERALGRAAGPHFGVEEGKEGEVLVQPGQTATVSFELVVLELPAGLEPGKTSTVRVEPFRVEAGGRAVDVPGFEFKLRSVLPASKKPAGPLRQFAPWSERFYWDYWLLAGWAAGLGLAAWSWRRWAKQQKELEEWLKSQRPSFLSAAKRMLQDLGALGRTYRQEQEPKELYRRLIVILNFVLSFRYEPDVFSKTDFSLDLDGARRTLRELSNRFEIKLTKDQVATLRSIADRSERLLYAEEGPRAGVPEADLGAAQSFIQELIAAAEAQQQRQPRRLGGFAFIGPVVSAVLGGFSGVTWGAPGILLLFVPLGAWAVWQLFKPKTAPLAAPAAQWVTAEPRWQRLARKAWAAVPKTLAVTALSLGILGAADPMWGFHRGERLVTSLDNVVVVDRSGSMHSGADGFNGTKMEAAKDAAKQFMLKQRGTTNRVGLVLFTEEARLVMNLTLDYDALESAFAVTEADGGTDIDVALDVAIRHFLEMGIVDLEESQAPGIGRVRDLLKHQGLGAALEEAAKDRSLLRAIQDPARNKVIIFLSDGDGGDPTASIERARALGIRIFAISIPPGTPMFLQQMAQQTGGKFFLVSDDQGMQDAFLEIDRLEKALVKTHALPRPIHHAHEFSQAAWWLLALSLLTAMPFPVRLRLGKDKLAAVALSFTLLAGAQPAQTPSWLPDNLGQPPAGIALKDTLPYREVAEIREATDLLLNGKAKEAIPLYRKAIREHPEYPELWVFLAMAHRQTNDAEAARGELTRALKLSREQHRADVLAAVQFEFAALALGDGSVPEALSFFREAIRVKPSGTRSQDKRLELIQDLARYDYELLLRNPPSQKGNQGKDKPKPGQPNAQGDPQSGGQGQDGSGGMQPPKSDGQQEGSKGDAKGGQQKPEQGQGEKKDQPGESKDGQSKGEDKGSKDGSKEGEAKPGTAADAAAEKALKELAGRDKEGGNGSGRGQRGGRVWGLAALGLPQIAEWLGQAPLAWPYSDYLLWTAALIPAVLVFAWWGAKKLFSAGRLLDGKSTPKRMLDWAPVRAKLRKTLLILSASALFAGAAAGPTKSAKDEQLTFGGKDIVLLQDVSLSILLAEDGRYAAATDGIDRFIRWLDNGAAADRVVLIPFAGAAGEAVLSDDYKNVLFQLYHLGQDARYLPEGSDIRRGVDGALRVFDAARDLGPRERVLIILSDGEEKNLYPDGGDSAMDSVIEQAKKRGITIYALGLGSTTGTRMVVPPQKPGDPPTYVEDGSGRPALTRLEPASLRELAESTGGAYFPAESGASIDVILAEIAAREAAKHEAQVPVEDSMSRWFLIPGVGLLLVGLMLGDGKRTAEAKPRASKKSSLSGLALLGLAPMAGTMPLFAILGVAAALLLLALPLFLPRRAAPDAEAPGERFGKVQRASYAVRMEKILRGEFRSLEPVRNGVEPDDPVLYTNESWKQVDHRTSARTGQLYAKRYEDEPEIPLMLVVDLSASGRFGSSGISKRDVAADAAGALALAAAREGMPVGAILFTDKVEKVLPPRSGLANAKALVRQVLEFEPEGTRTQLAPALNEALRRMPRRGVVAVLSDFDAANYEQPLAALGHRHILLPLVIEDRLETKAPPDLGPLDLVDPETGARGHVATQSGRARSLIWEKLNARRVRAKHAIATAGSRPLFLTNEEGYLNRLAAFFQNGGRS